MERRSRRRAAVALVAALCASATACGLAGSPGAPHTATPRPTISPKAPIPSGKPLGSDAKVPEPPRANDLDPSSVAVAWAKVANSYDTKYDTSPHDAELRSARYLTSSLATQEREYHPASGPGAQWNAWAEHKAWTSVVVKVDDRESNLYDTAALAYRQVLVKGRAHGRDGWSGAVPQLAAAVTLTRAGKGQPWRVSNVEITSAAAPPSGSPSTSNSPTQKDE
jgi:hypothetical protein